MSLQDDLGQLERIASLGAERIDFNKVVDAVALKISAGAAGTTAEAVQSLGDDKADKYIPVHRDYYKNLREEQRLAHERRMQDLEYEKEKVALANLKAASLAPAQP